MDGEPARDALPAAPYVLGHSAQELERLMLRARLYDPFTSQVFRDAGLAPGMRVLDVGAGSGDVSFLAARLVGPTGQVVGVEVTRIREDGVPTAEPAQRLNLDDSRAIERLLEVLREAAFELGRHRGRLEQALLDGAPVDEAEGAAEIARRLVDMLAPYVTEIAKRGSGRGELALKRDLGGGRREEIYVSKATLCERIGQLEPAERAVFDPLGLGEGSRSGVINGGRSLPPTLPAAALR